MKFIHTSDIHFGIVPDPARDWAGDRARAVKDTFSGIIEACSEEKADLLMICGDLFNGQPTEDELAEVSALLGRIHDTRVIITAGAGDHIIPNSPVTDFVWPDNVTYVTDDELIRIPLEEHGAELYARSLHRQGFTDMLSKLPVTDTSKFSILMTSGAGFRDPSADMENVAGAGFCYAALGGIHNRSELHAEGLTAVFPGCPEPVSDRDTGTHGYYIGETDGRTLTGLVFKAAARDRYVTLAVNVTPATTGGELERLLSAELENRGNANIFKIRLKGIRNPEETFNLAWLRSRWRISEIIDETEPRYDFRKLFREHPSDMIGLYIEKLYSPDASETDRKALSYGIDALLKTSDERSEG